jgi:fatty-acyl-CoA synthase
MASILDRVNTAVALTRGFTAPFERPDRLPKALAVMAPWGASVAGLAAGAAGRYPNRAAVIDDTGDGEPVTVTYGELWRRAHGIAAGLEDLGVGAGHKVGLLARNHSGFVEGLVAIAATGADVVLLNTGFAGPQLADVTASEGISVILHDDEFADIVADTGATAIGEAQRLELGRSHRLVKPTRRSGRVVILTSGTTGRPKGAARSAGASSIEGIAALLDAIPLRLGDTQVVAAPIFHAWGLSHLLLGLARSATTVMSRRFDPATTLRQVSEHAADVLVVVPVMLNRILAAAADSGEHPTPDLRVIAASGSALGAKLASDTQHRFGQVLYNLYGSTEVAVATVARPADLAKAPNTAGRPVLAVRVEILDSEGAPVPDGQIGRIFVGGAMKFDGYTDGAGKEVVRGLVSTGDLGRFDDGLLFVEGREDDMIISGGENVFPIEIEELLRHLPDVIDVAVVGVPDPEFGQAMAAFVVARPESSLGGDTVRQYVRDNLARHKVPRTVAFLDELPRNQAGKVLRRDLIGTASKAPAAKQPAARRSATKKPATKTKPAAKKRPGRNP